ncbi:hypothetical protein BCR34DRAFT_566654 [Clohesyomyces aquaticus]|uniref:Uncharacterized protein n=1 Tax=Clohesyomyces aquaticus TaxID=1231657 RepID=A0A1Y1ZKL4_9PLEO|nr:hypothetical protein BCR34DRAFT_566654 [Clohesyomyces aquaticus]
MEGTGHVWSCSLGVLTLRLCQSTGRARTQLPSWYACTIALIRFTISVHAGGQWQWRLPTTVLSQLGDAGGMIQQGRRTRCNGYEWASA